MQVIYEGLATMPFHEVLRAFGPENIIPDRSLSELLAVQTGADLIEALALLLAEVLSPGSQNLTDVPGQVSVLTPASIPEASARGSQLGSIIRKLPSAPQWSQVLHAMAQKLPNPTFTEASLSALLSTLDDQTIDSFLGFNWSLPFKVNLFINLRQLNPQNGAFDLLRTNYLKPIVSDHSFPNLKSSVLFFFNVTKLELDCISMSSAIASMEHKKFLHAIFEEDIRSVPELIALGCVHFTPQSATIDDLFENLMVHLLDNSSSYYTLILKDMKRKDLILEVCSKLYKSPSSLNPLIMALLVERELVEDFLKGLKFEDAFAVAVRAVKAGWRGFDDFLSKNAATKEAVDSILKYFDSISHVEESDKNNTKFVSLSAIHSLLSFAQKQNLTSSQLGELAEVQIRIYSAFPRLINFGYGHDEAILANGDDSPFPYDVEEQMKLCYQRMYADQLEIKNVVDMLARLRDSDLPRDQEIYACMIHSLLDEYRFFPEYPLSALAMTSVLFGSMILYDLMRGPALSIGLKYISDSCSQPAESNMFKFAVQGLFAFRSRLPEFPNYCSLLSKIEPLKGQPQVYQVIDDVVNNRVEHHEQTKADALNAVHAPAAQAFKSINPQFTVYNETHQTSRADTSNILFIINSLADDNVATKTQDLKAELAPSMYQWFAEYLVCRRAKVESNNQHLYAEVVHLFDDVTLIDQLVGVSVNEVNDLLNEHEETPQVRSNLKNLGSWLGRLTLAKNKPLKFSNIAVKQLLVEAYDLAKLALIIPFVCKLLEQTKESGVFKVPNPWTLGILRVLSELYRFANLKLNLRFEVEVLCNSLKIKISDIEPSVIVRSHLPTDIQSNVLLEAAMVGLKIDQGQDGLLQQGHDLTEPSSQFGQQQHAGGSASAGTSVGSNGLLSAGLGQLGASGLPSIQVKQQSAQPLNESPFQNLLGSTSFVTNETLKRLFVHVLTKSVRDILPPAVERAVSIAVTTARSLILKDFATEIDEIKLRNSSVTLVCHLAQGLALATCRDPLKESIQNSIHQLAPQLLNFENSPLDELPQAINDNIDLACSVIETAAMEKATQEVEEVLAPSIAARRTHKEIRPDQQFYTQYLSRYSVSLPDPLGLKPTGVTAQQLQVYESFGKKTSSASPADLLSQIQPQPQQEIAPPLTPNPSSTGLSTQASQQVIPQMAIEQTYGYVQATVENLCRAIAESPVKTLGELSTDSSINMLLSQILTLTSKCLANEGLLLKITQLVINALLSTSDIGFSAEIFVLLLKKICSISAVTRRDVSGWFLHAADERKFNMRVLLALFQSGLVSVPDFDTTLAAYITAEKPETALFAIRLISECLSSPDNAAFVSDFSNSIENLNAVKHNEICSFLASLKDRQLGIFHGSFVPEANRLEYVFTEWVHLLQKQPANTELELAFVHELVQSGLIASNAQSLFKSAVELSLAYFRQSDSVNDGFLLADSFSKLLVKLLVLGDNGDGLQLTLLKVALGVLTSVFADDHTVSKDTFNERPYFRIFSSLLSAFSSAEFDDAELKQTFYFTIADFLNVYQPLAFPGFAFAWITLISHRLFLPNILELSPTKAGKTKFVLLLIDLLKFQSKHIKEKQMSEVFTVVYKGTLRIFLLLLHDYPEVLINHHYQLCCEIPPPFTQLRNIVLSAVPEGAVIPDPFIQGANFEGVPECSEQPTICGNPGNDLTGLRKNVDGYLRIPSNQMVKSILHGLKQAEVDDCGIGYTKTNFNVKAINALVLYVGMQVVDEKGASSPVFDAKSSHFTLLASLALEGSVEFQYQLLQAMCNQLRHPNLHTQWFSLALLHFFGGQTLWGNKKLQLQQIFTRVLLERVLCSRPHPWGLLVTFTELLRNADLAFFDLSFVKSTPEIERLFQTLMNHMSARSATNNGISSAVPLHVAV